MRYQYDTTPTESHGRIANYNPATRDVDPAGTSLFDAPKLNFAPRIGFAYSPAITGELLFAGAMGSSTPRWSPRRPNLRPRTCPASDSPRL